jgi:hypothetical protein
MIGAPIEKPGRSTEKGIRKRSRLLPSVSSRTTASLISRSSSRGMAGARKRLVKKTFGSIARLERKSSSSCRS